MQITKEYKGYRIEIEIEQDDMMGPPWEEHDGHGPVSEWTRRNKRAGELVLCEDRGSKRYYDFAEAVKIAKRDRWGVENPEGKTAGQIASESAMADFKHLRAWCNNEWCWCYYAAKVFNPDGELVEEESCGGFDGWEFCEEEAVSVCESIVDKDIEAQLKAQAEEAELRLQTQVAECYP